MNELGNTSLTEFGTTPGKKSLLRRKLRMDDENDLEYPVARSWTLSMSTLSGHYEDHIPNMGESSWSVDMDSLRTGTEVVVSKQMQRGTQPVEKQLDPGAQAIPFTSSVLSMGDKETTRTVAKQAQVNSYQLPNFIHLKNKELSEKITDCTPLQLRFRESQTNTSRRSGMVPRASDESDPKVSLEVHDQRIDDSRREKEDPPAFGKHIPEAVTPVLKAMNAHDDVQLSGDRLGANTTSIKSSASPKSIDITPTAPPARLEDYEELDVIGKGTFGKVCRIRCKHDNQIYVWKVVQYGKMSSWEKKLLVSEVNLMRELEDEHIVKYYDRIIDKKSQILYIVMEYCAGGDLSQLIKRHRYSGRRISETKIWSILYQMLLALRRIHSGTAGCPVLHRDLKPANIFLDATHTKVKVGDFGLARKLERQDHARTFVGTPYYMSPEQVREQVYNAKADVWSLGCLIYELAALKPPFDSPTGTGLRLRILDGKYPQLKGYSRGLQEIVGCMLHVSNLHRYTVDDLLKHPQLIKNMRSLMTPAGEVAALTEPKSPIKLQQQPRTALNTTNTAESSPIMENATPLRSNQDQCKPSNAILAAIEVKDDNQRARQAALDERERALDHRERLLQAREANLARRERDLARRQEALQQKQSEHYRQRVALHKENVKPFSHSPSTPTSTEPAYMCPSSYAMAPQLKHKPAVAVPRHRPSGGSGTGAPRRSPLTPSQKDNVHSPSCITGASSRTPPSLYTNNTPETYSPRLGSAGYGYNRRTTASRTAKPCLREVGGIKSTAAIGA
eukprot:Clim_evm112s11 gene=Clim_evmTU112s11